MDCYFAMDGNYGVAKDMLLVDTSSWTQEDWDTVDNCVDSERLNLALLIASKYE